MVHCAVHIAARGPRKEKAAMPDIYQAMRLVLFAKLTCILNESASHFWSVCFPFRASKTGVFTFWQIQSRKVHENLVSAQPAHNIFRVFYWVNQR